MSFDFDTNAPCPCCSGALEGRWENLCDDCLAAWMAGLAENHECQRAAPIPAQVSVRIVESCPPVPTQQNSTTGK